MQLDIDLETVDGVAMGIVSGRGNVEDLQTIVTELWDAIEGPDLRILWDFRDARFDVDGDDDVRKFAEFVKKTAPTARLRTALVASTDLEFGLIRMFEVYRQKENSTTAAFREKSRALEWLCRTEGR